jgi:hypothetical protein
MNAVQRQNLNHLDMKVNKLSVTPERRALTKHQELNHLEIKVKQVIRLRRGEFVRDC